MSQGRVWGVVSDIPGKDTTLLDPSFSLWAIGITEKKSMGWGRRVVIKVK